MKRRARRSPEEARQLIASAARDAFTEVGPERVTLRDVARRAGVSHALVAHYFGSYDELVRAVLAEVRGEALLRLVAARRREEALDAAFDFLMNPLRRRLRAFLDAREGAPAKRARGELVVAFIAAYVNERAVARGRPPVSLPDVRAVVDVLVAAAQGYVPSSPAADARFRATLRDMFEAYVGRRARPG